ncbi:GNAT family N-acetyltransferase [Compostimonas suwonensis]|uniref:Acetyltransferase (GNAT) family protein n=1 Tax=Compostimonas suwonensis TaxID=1048394 RepID=A0A2M9BWK0_9MICO|nr:GNAT family N-acetyltransferase [Compostimonas suwonensis]PJJ62320.1 acetyltransferase (GNAT) family protein [Compostimonas suwonensis]
MTLLDSPYDRFVSVRYTDDIAKPLIDDLEHEYNTRYSDILPEPAAVELHRYPVEDFAEPHGAFLLLLRDERPIAGGAFKRYDERTAELKRIWTHPEFRNQGLARLVVVKLEIRAAEQGYSRIFLTTGPRQPEAKRLYLATGYTPLYDTELPAEEVGIHAFEKILPEREARS